MPRKPSEETIIAKNAAINALNLAGTDATARINAISAVPHEIISSILRDMIQSNLIRLPDGAIPEIVREHYGNTEAIRSVRVDIQRWMIGTARVTPTILNYTGKKLSLPLWYDPDCEQAEEYRRLGQWNSRNSGIKRRKNPVNSSLRPMPTAPAPEIAPSPGPAPAPDPDPDPDPKRPSAASGDDIEIPAALASWPTASALPIARLRHNATTEEIMTAYEESANADPAPERPPLGLNSSPEIRNAYRISAEECIKRAEQRQNMLQAAIEAAFSRANAIIAAHEIKYAHAFSHPLLVGRDDLGIMHPAAEEIIDALLLGINVCLVGPAGTGKTHLAETITRAMGRKFGVCSVTGGTSESKLVGMMIPTGGNLSFEYHPSPLVQLTEEGNANFLFDEFDRGDPNTLTLINSLLANGYISIPQRIGKTMLYKAENVGFLAAANTYGSGVDYKYTAANALDAATLDRFYFIYIDYDPVYESSLAGLAEPPSQVSARLKTRRMDAEIDQDCMALYRYIVALRAGIDRLQLQRVVGRSLHNGIKMLKTGHYTLSHIKSRILAPFSPEERDQLTRIMEDNR